MIPHEPSARLRLLYAEHVEPVRNGRPAMSLESQLHAVRHAREWGMRRQLLADALGVALDYISALEQELGVELDP
jgi:hypothetical protein